ncbi:L-lactate dehydrogenase [Trueperella bonasi]|uniref:L-lactate dehydrogenase n=1 Tax=Trueperella bonasi TaxID=312286 RepID=A0ABT9NFJ4_9ACTO|nr:L-lactate dehydrogenase [Trueperella bonasi]MDP9806162.1 L-lactate dehydrogenase [Trueperella bonasi]
MTTFDTSKLTVVGAGSVGTALAYACQIRGSASTIALYDINEPKVEAEVLDLAHGSQFMQASQLIGGADMEVTAGSDVVVITAGAKQQPGQTRLDLAAKNVAILEDMLPKLVEYSPEAVFILVTNPVDVLTYVATKIVDLPEGRVFGSGTVLDSSRLRWLVGKKIGVSARSVHAMMIGEHGDSEFALWSSASIGQIPLRKWTNDDGEHVFDPETLSAIENEVVNAAYRIIDGKGATNYAIGISGARIVEAVLGDHKSVLPVSSIGSGADADIALSVPCLVGRTGVLRTLEIDLDEAEREKFEHSKATLRKTIASVGY